MIEFAKQDYTVQATYEVAIHVDGIEYMYLYICSNHDEALNLAIAEHMGKGLPLPLGTRCLVVGTCTDLTCKCDGKIRARAYLTLPESSLC